MLRSLSGGSLIASVLFGFQAEVFCKQHIHNSLNFPLGSAGGTIVGPEDGNFAMWVSCLFSLLLLPKYIYILLIVLLALF